MINNTINVDKKVQRLIDNSNSGGWYLNGDIESVSKCLKLLNDKYMGKPKDSDKFDNIFVINKSGNDSSFSNLQNRLTEIEKMHQTHYPNEKAIHFAWSNLCNNEIEDSSNYKLIITYIGTKQYERIVDTEDIGKNIFFSDVFDEDSETIINIKYDYYGNKELMIKIVELLNKQ